MTRRKRSDEHPRRVIAGEGVGSAVGNGWTGETGQSRIRRMAVKAINEGRIERAKGLVQALACVRRAETAAALWRQIEAEAKDG